MFDNVGKKLQVVAKVCLWIGIAVSVISGIATASNMYRGGFLSFLLIAVFGSIGSYLSSLFLFAFGEMVENTARIREDTRYLCENSAKVERVKEEKKEATKKYSAEVNVATAKVKCSECGTEQPADRSVCLWCGNPLSKTQPAILGNKTPEKNEEPDN